LTPEGIRQLHRWMPIALTDKKAAQVSNVEFVLTERARINKLLCDTPPTEWKNLPRDELIGSLPHPSGRTRLTGPHAEAAIEGAAEGAFRLVADLVSYRRDREHGGAQLAARKFEP
jgi:hypothetical protein